MEKMIMKRPANIEDLVNCLAEADDNTYLLSGGTDFIIKLRRLKLYSGTIIDMKNIKDLNFIKKKDGYICIGASTTFTEINNNTIIKEYARALGEAAGKVGSTQIRNVATIAGNIANSAPCADSVTALIALEAKARIIDGLGAITEKSIDDIVIGSEKNALQKNQAIVEIIIPIKESTRSVFCKLGSRSSVTISKLNMAIVLKQNHERIIEEARVVVGALGPKAFTSSIVSNALLGENISKKLIYILEEALQKQVDESIVGRGSHPYKREAIRGLANDTLKMLFPEIMTGGELS